MSHDVGDALHHTVQLQCDTDCLGNIACVLDAHADKLSNLVEPFPVTGIKVFVIPLVNELDDSNRSFIGHAGHSLAVDGPDHKIANVSHLGLVIDLVHEARLFFSVIAHEELAAHEDLTRQARVRRKVVELGLLLEV